MFSYLKKKYVIHHLKSLKWNQDAVSQKWVMAALANHVSLEMMVHLHDGTERNLLNWAYETFPTLRVEIWDNLKVNLNQQAFDLKAQKAFWENKSVYWIQTKQWKQMNAWWTLCPMKNWNERFDFLHRMEKQILDKAQKQRNFQVVGELTHLYDLFRNAPPRKHSWIVASILKTFPKVCDVYEQAWQIRQRAFPLHKREEKELRRGHLFGKGFAEILNPYIQTPENLVRGLGLFEQENASLARQSFRDSTLIQMAVATFTADMWNTLKEMPYYRHTLTLSQLEKHMRPPYPPTIPMKDLPSFELSTILEDKSSFYGQSVEQRERLRLQAALRHTETGSPKVRL